MFLDDLYHSLDPVAFSLGPLTVRWYGLAYLAGFVLCGLLLYRIARRWKLDLTADDVLNVMTGICLGIIVGGRLGYVLFYGAGYYLADPLRVFAFNEGGMSFHGGLVGAVAGVEIPAFGCPGPNPNEVRGQCLAGSLTGVVASKSVTEAFKGALRTIGNRAQSILV